MKSPIGYIAYAGALILALSTSSYAQVAEKKTLTLEGAKKVAAAAEAEARRNNEGAVIAVVDDGGNLMLLERIDGTFPAGAKVSIGKARTAALFKKPTSFFEEIIHDGRTAMVAVEDFTPLQGGVPIEVDREIVGAVGVSGAANQQQDEAVAKAGAAAIK
jgi:glc operon protein GlcG